MSAACTGVHGAPSASDTRTVAEIAALADRADVHLDRKKPYAGEPPAATADSSTFVQHLVFSLHTRDVYHRVYHEVNSEGKPGV